MTIDTNALFPMTEANRNFSQVARKVETDGIAVILKNNKPKFVVVDFAEYEAIRAAKAERQRLVADTVDSIIAENSEALEELAK